MIENRERLDLLHSLSQVPVTQEAISLTERFALTCKRIFPPTLISGLNRQDLPALMSEASPTFSFFQRVFPRVALTLVETLGPNIHSHSIGVEEILFTFAGDAHLRTVVHSMAQISGARTISNYLQCLAIGGRKEGTNLLHVSQTRFPLCPDSQSKHTGNDFVVSHLGQPILFCREGQIKALDKFQSTQPKVSLLFDDARGKTLSLVRFLSERRK